MRTDLTLELGVTGQMSNDIGIDDAFEVGLRATEYLRCLAFLIYNLDLSDIDEKEKSALNNYLMPLGEMIYAFSSQAFWMLDTLENERKRGNKNA